VMHSTVKEVKLFWSNGLRDGLADVPIPFGERNSPVPPIKEAFGYIVSSDSNVVI